MHRKLIFFRLKAQIIFREKAEDTDELVSKDVIDFYTYVTRGTGFLHKRCLIPDLFKVDIFCYFSFPIITDLIML